MQDEHGKSLRLEALRVAHAVRADNNNARYAHADKESAKQGAYGVDDVIADAAKLVAFINN